MARATRLHLHAVNDEDGGVVLEATSDRPHDPPQRLSAHLGINLRRRNLPVPQRPLDEMQSTP